MKRAYKLSRDGLHSLRLHADFRKCMFCGKFISYVEMESNLIGWYDPTCHFDLEPRERIPYHKRCYKD